MGLQKVVAITLRQRDVAPAIEEAVINLHRHGIERSDVAAGVATGITKAIQAHRQSMGQIGETPPGLASIPGIWLPDSS